MILFQNLQKKLFFIVLEPTSRIFQYDIIMINWYRNNKNIWRNYQTLKLKGHDNYRKQGYRNDRTSMETKIRYSKRHTVLAITNTFFLSES